MQETDSRQDHRTTWNRTRIPACGGACGTCRPQAFLCLPRDGVASETHPSGKTTGRHGADNDSEAGVVACRVPLAGMRKRACQSSTSGRTGAAARPTMPTLLRRVDQLAQQRRHALSRRGQTFFELVENEAVTGATRLYHRDLGLHCTGQAWRSVQRTPQARCGDVCRVVSRLRTPPSTHRSSCVKSGRRRRSAGDGWRFASRAGGIVAEWSRGN